MKFRIAILLAFCLVVFPLQALSAPTIEDFTRAADIHDVELSPSGRYLAMILNQGNVRMVVVRDLDVEGAPVIGAIKEELIRPSFLSWATDDRLLISMLVPWDMKQVRREMDQEDFDIRKFFMMSRMISTDRTLSDFVILMEGERSLRYNISLSRVTHFLPNDDDHVLMAAYKGNKRTLYKVNILTGESEIMARGGYKTYKFLSDDEGQLKYRFDYREASNSIEIFQYDGEDDWQKIDRIYLDQDDENQLDTNNLVVLSSDSLVYRLQNEETGYYELITVDRETQEKSTLVSVPDQDVRGALINNRSDQIVGYTLEDDFVRYKYFDEEKQARYDEIAEKVGSYNFRVETLNPDNKRTLVRTSGVDDPRSYYLWNFESKTLEFAGHAYDGLATDKLARSAMATYKARDGQSIRVYLTLPPGFSEGEPHPTIILPHGGPHARSRPEFSSFTQFLATRGYIVVEPNFRGSVGYGKAFEEAGYKQWGGLMQDDVTDAVEFLVKKGYTDPNRVCIVGFSYGGYAALMGAIKTPDLYQCAISLNGVTHMTELIKYDKKKLVDKDDWDEVIYKRRGHPKEDEAMLDANSPALHADKIKIPVMIVAGTDDEIVPFKQAELMVKALKKAGVEYEFIELEDTGHNPIYYREDVEVVLPAVEKFIADAFQ